MRWSTWAGRIMTLPKAIIPAQGQCLSFPEATARAKFEAELLGVHESGLPTLLMLLSPPPPV